MKFRIPYFLIMFCLVSSLSQARIIDQIVAKINGEIITLSEVRKNYIQYKQFSRVEDESFKTEREFLDLMIEQRLKLQYAKKKGIEPSKQDVYDALDNFKKKNLLNDEMFSVLLVQENQTLDDYKKKISEQIVLSRLNNFEVESKIVVGSDEVEKYYYEHQGEFLTPAEVKIGNIFFAFKENTENEKERIKEKAAGVLEKIKNGGDFISLAKEYSQAPNADKGGILGYFKPGSMLPEFDTAIINLKEGQASGLIETKTGYHLLYVFEKKNEGINFLEKVRKEIENKIFVRKFRLKYETWVKELRDQSYVEILYANNEKE